MYTSQKMSLHNTILLYTYPSYNVYTISSLEPVVYITMRTKQNICNNCNTIMKTMYYRKNKIMVSFGKICLNCKKGVYY